MKKLLAILVFVLTLNPSFARSQSNDPYDYNNVLRRKDVLHGLYVIMEETKSNHKEQTMVIYPDRVELRGAGNETQSSVVVDSNVIGTVHTHPDDGIYAPSKLDVSEEQRLGALNPNLISYVEGRDGNNRVLTVILPSGKVLFYGNLGIY